MTRLMNAMELLSQTAFQSITLDRGIETEVWFCDPQALWQKGSVENLNKQARWYLPRDTPISKLLDRNMKAICNRLNGKPRKCLGWRTPTDRNSAFREGAA